MRGFQKRHKKFVLGAVISIVLVLLLWRLFIDMVFSESTDATRVTWQNPTLRNIFVNRTVANELYRKVRVLCLIPTLAKNEATKVRAVNGTWGSRCNKLLFVFASYTSVYSHISVDVADGRDHLTSKTMEALRVAYQQYGRQYDWIIKADDDSYVILENLRFLLSKFDPSEPAYLGFHFKLNVNNGYMSGGGTYVMSMSAVRLLVENGLAPGGGCAHDGPDEDVDVGLCMEHLGVKPYSTRDKFHRDAFHVQTIREHIVGPIASYLSYYPTHPIKLGPQCCSQFSVSFHYVVPDMMYMVEMLLYRISVYGATLPDPGQLQDVFKKEVSVITDTERKRPTYGLLSFFESKKNTYIPPMNS